MKLSELFNDDLNEDQRNLFKPGYTGRQGDGYGTGYNTYSGNNYGSKISNWWKSKEQPQVRQISTKTTENPPPQQESQPQYQDPPGDGPYPNYNTARLVQEYKLVYNQQMGAELIRRKSLGYPTAQKAVITYGIKV